MAEQPTRCGFVALIGATNVGKSTLVNALVGTKVAIVSHKVQTTRTQVRGIAIENGAQIIFVDTPGIFAPKRRLDRAMVTTAWAGAHDADVVCLLLDAKRGIDEETSAIVERLGGGAGAARGDPQQDRSRRKADAADACEKVERARRAGGDLHDLGAHR